MVSLAVFILFIVIVIGVIITNLELAANGQDISRCDSYDFA